MKIKLYSDYSSENDWIIIPEGSKLKDALEINEEIIIIKINGEVASPETVLKENDEVKLVRFSGLEGKEIFWHSSAHIMAQAVKRIFPKAKLAIGPPIENGFYYDIDFENPFTEEDLKRIEKEMKKIIKQNLKIERMVLPKEKAQSHFSFEGEVYKLDIINEIEEDTVSLYKQGEFVDLCRGPHVISTGVIKHFKLLSVAGAYWRGNEKNKMLQRIYGISFPKKEMLDEYIKGIEEAKKRDHRVLGKKLGIYSIYEEAGPGLIYWLPKGAIIRHIVEEFWLKEHLKEGYQQVYTPHIARAKLWQTSGHYDFYKENMFFTGIDEQEYAIKPMNCPGHILIYKSNLHSYKELPIKYAELGTVYRNEKSGVLHGMLRVRGFTQDDAHVFCRPDQVKEEVEKIVKMAIKFMHIFGYREFHVELSVRDSVNKEKYAGTDEEWELAESSLIEVLEKMGISYNRAEGEAVFYGPKIDIKLKDMLGRYWQGPTIQFDFNLPHRFNVVYTDKDNTSKHVVMIHRALFGSLERFIGGLIEHYGGNLPVWLSPYQIAVISITDEVLNYAKTVAFYLIDNGFRVKTLFSSDKVSYKIREAEKEKIPYMVIIGKEEMKNDNISIRKHQEGDKGKMMIPDFVSLMKKEIDSRR